MPWVTASCQKTPMKLNDGGSLNGDRGVFWIGERPDQSMSKPPRVETPRANSHMPAPNSNTPWRTSERMTAAWPPLDT